MRWAQPLPGSLCFVSEISCVFCHPGENFDYLCTSVGVVEEPSISLGPLCQHQQGGQEGCRGVLLSAGLAGSIFSLDGRTTQEEPGRWL